MSDTDTLTLSTSSVPDNFQLESVIAEDVQTKTVVLLGHCGDKDKKAIVVLEKKNFESETMGSFFDDLKKKLIFENDVYTNWNAIPTADEHKAVSCRCIYPADAAHIKKYTKSARIYFEETYEVYKSSIEPWVTTQQNRIEWVHNILNGTAEQDRLLLNTENFVMLPDYKWHEGNLDQLYCLVIFKDLSLRSIRDLKDEHLGLLENTLKQVQKKIHSKYNVHDNQLLAFFHYHPSYYQLHLHVIRVGHVIGGAHVGVAHSLTSVMENLKMKKKFYQKAVLGYSLSTNSQLYEILKTAF